MAPVIGVRTRRFRAWAVGCGLALSAFVAAPETARAQAPAEPRVTIDPSAFLFRDPDVDQPGRGLGGAVSFRWKALGTWTASLVVGFDGMYFQELDFRRTAATGGLALSAPIVWRFRAFGQALAGLEACCGETYLVLEPSGGLDYWLARRLAVRAQVGLRAARFSSEWTGGLRLAAGARLALGPTR
jgi:hypothetical protein